MLIRFCQQWDKLEFDGFVEWHFEEHITGISPFIQPVLKQYASGMHKCIPYAHVETFLFNEPVKFQFIGAVPVEGPRSCGLIAQGS